MVSVVFVLLVYVAAIGAAQQLKAENYVAFTPMPGSECKSGYVLHLPEHVCVYETVNMKCRTGINLYVFI